MSKIEQLLFAIALGQLVSQNRRQDCVEAYLLYEQVVLQDLASLHDSDDGRLQVELAILVHRGVRRLHLLRRLLLHRGVDLEFCALVGVGHVQGDCGLVVIQAGALL